MKKISYLITLALMVGLVACNNPSGKKQKSESAAENSVEAMKTGKEMAACNHQTKIYWRGSKPVGEHNGVIKIKEGGNFLVNDGELVGGKFIIDMHSIVDLDLKDPEKNAKLVGHLKSEDFFYVDSFPEATFEITSVEKSDVEGFNKKITGNLTMKNITHSIAFNANVMVNENMVVAKTEDIVLDRTKWNVNYGSKSVFKDLKDKFINDEFTISIDAHSM